MPRPILVTGAHRSGTTWVGKMIAYSPQVGYIHEPFNLTTRPGICGTRFTRQFTYVTDDNARPYESQLAKTFAFQYNLLGELATVRSPRSLLRMLRDSREFRAYRRAGVRPLVKDPLALFSAEWLVREFDMQVVVLIRHPAAFASSVKRFGWTHPFEHFTQQSLIMRDHLAPFEAEVRDYAANEHDAIDHSILLWRLIYNTVHEYQQRHPEWFFVKHEDLSIQPMDGYTKIFSDLGIDLTDDIRTTIEEYSGTANPGEAPADVGAFKIDSAANVSAWKQRLSPDEIFRIREGKADVWRYFYEDGEW